MIKALLWKEWRELRLFVFLALGMVVLSWVLLEVVPAYRGDKNLSVLVTILFALPLLFSLFLGVLPFTNEFSRKTQSFLLSTPISTGKIFWTKFLFGLFLLLTLILFSHAVVYIFLMPHVGVEDYISYLPSYLILPYILIYCAAFFASLLVGAALAAILSTPFILLCGILLLSPMLTCLILMFPSRNTFVFSILVLMGLFVMSSFFIWRKGGSRSASSSKAVMSAAIVALIISFGAHAVFNGNVALIGLLACI